MSADQIRLDKTITSLRGLMCLHRSKTR